MSIVLIKTLQLLCCLSLLVVLHELGHFGFARLFGVRVERFYMFFNWKFHLFSTRDGWFTRLFPHFRTNETEYGLGWIPLGGYCEIAGMVDETSTEEKREAQKQDKHPEQLFLNHPVWHRFFIMVGGVLMNLLTAVVIYCAIAYTWGEDVVAMKDMHQGFQFNEVAQRAGFRNGDIPVAFDGTPLEYYNTADLLRGFSDADEVTVLRHGETLTITQPADHPNLLDLQEMLPPYAVPYVPAEVDSVLPATPAAQAGLAKGTRLIAIDGHRCETWTDYDSLMTARAAYLKLHATPRDSVRLRRITLTYAAPGHKPQTRAVTLTPEYKLGVVRSTLLGLYTPRHISYDLVEAIPAGVSHGWQSLVGYVGDLKYIFSKKGAESVGSFVTIGSIFPDTWNWYLFWHLTALISIILAVMNILPIPGLDGGHVCMLIYEKITGHEPSERAQVVLQYIGMAIIIALMVLAFGNDIRRFILPLFGL